MKEFKWWQKTYRVYFFGEIKLDCALRRFAPNAADYVVCIIVEAILKQSQVVSMRYNRLDGRIELVDD